MFKTLTLLLAILLWACEGLAAAFEYVDPADKGSTLTIETSPPTVAIGDIAEPATLCPRTDRFVCLLSRTINFAVPKKIDPATPRWEQAGHIYEIASNEDLLILGARIRHVFRIKSLDGDRRITYLYSKERGLLGLQVASPVGQRLFLTTKRIGYGAVSASGHRF